jgi:dihydroorotase
VLESFDALDKLEGFVSSFGRAFYRRNVRPRAGIVTLGKTEGKVIPQSWTEGEQSVVPFWAGRTINWEIREEQ